VVLEAVFTCIRVSDSINAAFSNVPPSSGCNEVSFHGSFATVTKLSLMSQMKRSEEERI